MEHGIEFEVVPGITSAQGCATVAGVPLTHRGLATSVRYITGHCRDDAALDFDWQGLADPNTTLVIYMGAANIALIARELMDAGLDGATPVLISSSGTTEAEQRVITRLDRAADQTANGGFEGPVLYVIGKVVTLASQLGGADARDGDIAPAQPA
jgi:uroporphyrin-III C-methyltransferase